MSSTSSPLAFLTCSATGGSCGAKYFSAWDGVRGWGAGATRRFSAGEAKVSPSLPLLWRKAPLSAFLGRMPKPGPFSTSALSVAIVTWTTFGP
ncbi:MAG: hypothetical protein K0R43_151 [Pseudoduganella sp.]|nr:hypothetical protein [Pseudoduganella sp.]